MKNLTNHILLATAVIMSLSACGVKERSDTKTSEKTVIETKADMNADELADAAEQLVTPYTFMLADKVLDQALEKDPKNLKAQFYKSFLKRFMVLKGIYSRGRSSVVNSKEAVDAYNSNISNMPNSPLKKFLLDGKADLKNENDIQNLVSEYENALEDLHLFLVRNADAEITLNMNPYVFEKEIQDEWGKSCVIVEHKNENTRVECDLTNSATRKVNSADLMVLRQAVGYERWVWAMYNSYSFDGIMDLSKKYEGKEVSELEKWKAINSSPNLFKLRGQAKISAIKDIFGDMASAARWVLKYQDRLCPKGPEAFDQRRGHLFSQGLCVVMDATQLQNLDLIEKAIAGPMTHEMRDENGNVTDAITVDFLAWSRNAPKDLKKVIIPEIRDYACGEKLEYKDKTLGGMFVKGEFDKVAPTLKNCTK